MTRLYRPVLIESAEQAEALPIGTVALDRDHETEPDLLPYVKVTPKLWVSVWDVSDDHELDSYGVRPNSHIVGDTALVPIEAEEETRTSETRSRWRGFKETRLVTTWRAAQ